MKLLLKIMCCIRHTPYILCSSIYTCCVNIFLVSLLCLAPALVKADMDFYSIAENATVMYDAPSVKSGKLYIAGANLPIEAIVNVEGWVKVRDSSGSLAWVEKKALSKQRFVIVTVPVANIYHKAEEGAEMVYQAQENVVLEWLDSNTPGWVRVRHQDGQTGFVRADQVWGS
ncbi:SH3-like domain-containing protein [Nitrosomonas marina]|uniref:SH3-like domain-containing protein n=2 Tax=Nitrosomonas marina TaxID=917 RepID=A0A1I0DSP5_9PROT|nr:SH3-like domain-containing protein [Nitrosomonas marina]